MSTGLQNRRTTVPPHAKTGDGRPVWREAAELGPVFTGIVFALGAVAHMFRIPFGVDLAAAGTILMCAAVVAVWMTRSAAMLV